MIFDRLRSRFGIDLIITPSDEFYWIREFITVAKEQGVRTVIVDKEGTKSPQYFEAQSARTRRCAPCISHHVYVWSERQRQYWDKIGVVDKNISIIGQPRSDLFYIEKKNEVDRLFSKTQPLVTFFSYEDNAYIPVDIAYREGVTWGKMKTETHDELYRLAQRYRNYNFVVKTHPQQMDLEELQAKYRLENFRVIGGSSVANELIQRSELIIAFQTTAIIEAMFLNKAIIYTYWDPLIPRFREDLLPFHKAKGILVARSLEEFRRMCQRFLGGDRSQFNFSKEELKERDRFVNEYLYRPDGHVCERFYRSVKQFVQ
jgi:CDP-glycerol glycerophosphotransferase (TagB/SpsB family)